MKIQNFTLHTHNSEMSFDGLNTAEEMISGAVEKGFKTIGVSNHLICHKNLLKYGNQTMYFRDFTKGLECWKKHIDIVRNLQSKYSIRILVGFEVDFYESAYWRDNFEKIRPQLDVDYLIGSTHFIRTANEDFICNIYQMHYIENLSQRPGFEEYLRNYWRNIIQAISSGYFDFIAHIDYCGIFDLCTDKKWDEYKWQVIEALDKYKQAYEINTSGYNRINMQHPSDWMVKELCQRKVPVVISDDAHKVSALGQHFARAEELLAQYGCSKRFSL